MMAWTYGDSTAPFQYEELASQSMRILRIEDTDIASDIVLSMRSYTRRDAPPYVAISYTWGDEPASHQVLINGSIFNVRPNLWHCLVHITREEEAKDEWRNLWIDAICIDQSSIAEKNEQVSSMHLTFHDATMCIAWLGLYPGTDIIHHPDDHDLPADGQSFLPDRLVRRELFLQPYFRRIWIVQELIVSRKVLYLWGRRRIGWIDFIASLRTFLTQMDGNILEARLLLNGWFSDVWRPLATFVLTKSQENKTFSWRRPLSTMLSDVRKSLCTEPRDRVFGLLNILPTHERQILGTFFPDYSLSLERVQLITLAFLRLQSSSLRKWHSQSLKSLLWMLHIQSEDMHTELTEKSRPDPDTEDKTLFHNFKYVRSPARWIHDNYAAEPREDDWIQKRIDALRNIASKPLSTESSLHAKQLLEKPWYVPIERSIAVVDRSFSAPTPLQRVVRSSKSFYKQTLTRRTF